MHRQPEIPGLMSDKPYLNVLLGRSAVSLANEQQELQGLQASAGGLEQQPVELSEGQLPLEIAE